MAGNDLIRVRFDDRAVRRGLRKLEDKRKELATVFRSLRKPLHADLLGAADRERSPAGRRWQPLAPATVAHRAKHPAARTKTTRERRRRKMKGGGAFSGPLRQTKVTTTYGNVLGSIPTSVGVRVTKAGPSLIARSSSPISVIHNEGGVGARGTRIPAREFLAWSPPFLQLAEQRIAAFVLTGWEGK